MTIRYDRPEQGQKPSPEQSPDLSSTYKLRRMVMARAISEAAAIQRCIELVAWLSPTAAEVLTKHRETVLAQAGLGPNGEPEV